MRRRHGDLPPGWPILLASVVLIYAPVLVVDAVCWVIDRLRETVRTVDENLADLGTEDME
jgi:hypothetical protein